MIEGPRLNNDGVIKAWQQGLSARNSRRTLTSVSYPSGRAELYSYRLKIGVRTPAGALILADFTAPVGGFHSQTTSCHVGLAKREAANPLIMHPKVWQCSPLSTDGKPF
jgi:hypothetical protein